jgi:hypothetical protein
MRKIYCPGNFRIEPWDSRFYALFQGEELVCVTAYKKGAVRVMDLFYSFQISLERLKFNERLLPPMTVTIKKGLEAGRN